MKVFLLLLALIVAVCHCQEEVPSVVKKALDYSGDQEPRVSRLYQTAKIWLDDDDEKTEDAWELFSYLADEKMHVPSVAKMGLKHAEEGRNDEALRCFRLASQGNHHASMYNAGRMLALEGDWVGSLAYLKAAASNNQPASQEAYEIVSRQVAHSQLSIRESADIFLYASLQDDDNNNNDELEGVWRDAVLALTGDDDDDKTTTMDAMVRASRSLRTIWESYTMLLSPLQSKLVLDAMNNVLGPLSTLDETYLPMAAGYAEALAASSFCFVECFGVAASRAMSYYLRLDDVPSVKRMMETAHWDSILQTPPTYYPELESKPWWHPTDFPITTTLHAMQNTITQELQAIKPQLETTKTSTTLGVRVDREGNKQLEGWSELRLASDGHCQIMPTVCRVLLQQEHQVTTVSVQRLRAGTSILPHCGATNAYLTMHMALEGWRGVRITVGQTTVEDYGNNNPIVFDGSFQHAVDHRGTSDLYVIKATWNHPDWKQQ